MSPRPSDEREYAPDFDAEEQSTAPTPRYGFARKLAQNLLKECGVMAAPVDIPALIAHRSLRLKMIDISSPLSGQLYADDREIVVNRLNRSDGRQRFTMAHELGHWELNHYKTSSMPADDTGYSGIFEDYGSGDGNSVIEREANAFAAELLMPGAWIRRILKPLSDGQPARLAAEYGVSLEAMFYQLMTQKRL